MMKKQKSISIKTILMVVVVLLGTVPLLLMHSIVNKAVKINTLSNTTSLTFGILEQSQKYLNEILNSVDSFSSEVINNGDIISILDRERISPESVKLLKSFKARFKYVDEFVVVDTDSSFSSVLLKRDKPREIDREMIEEFLKSQPALLLMENSARNLWLGSAPSGIEDLSPSIWNYRIVNIENKSFILATSIEISFFSELLKSVERSTNSEVRLITSDNSIFPADDTFFSYSFAPRSLSRSEKGEFTSFTASRTVNGQNENLLVQVYSDSDHFYNFIVITPEYKLLRGFDSISHIMTITLVVLALFSIVLGLLGVILIKKRLFTYIEVITHISHGIYDTRSLIGSGIIKENNLLTNAIIDMAKEVRDNREKLRNINKGLKQNVIDRTRELNIIKDSLVHSEKMASLSHNASKIAHEINNPLGISVTATTHFRDIILELENKLNNNTLSKTYFSQFIESSKDISGMILNNLKQAIEISSKFKNFAADQSSDEKRELELKSYITELVKSYDFQLRNSKYKITIICGSIITVKTYPGIIYQILSNLINNSLIHGFEGRDTGSIEIIITDRVNSVEICVKDDGVGISKEHLFELYKPFFSTKMGRGGTGLGLNIIKELINNKLKGTIECKSLFGEGTQFIIIFPKGD